MNANLKQRIKQRISDVFTIDDEMAKFPEEDRSYAMYQDDLQRWAEHFYNLALEDVRKGVERRIVRNKCMILNIIDNLTK